jgi:hypothetical protein
VQSKLIVVAAIKLAEQHDNKGGFTIDEVSCFTLIYSYLLFLVNENVRERLFGRAWC